MIWIVAGGRDFSDQETLFRVLDQYVVDDDKVVHGGCPRGVDSLAQTWAENNNFDVSAYPADWHTFGRSAGPRRNAVMAQESDGLIAFWDGKSRGTRNMIDNALEHGLEVHVFRYGN
jgi:hypothetical protein